MKSIKLLVIFLFSLFIFGGLATAMEIKQMNYSLNVSGDSLYNNTLVSNPHKINVRYDTATKEVKIPTVSNKEVGYGYKITKEYIQNQLIKEKQMPNRYVIKEIPSYELDVSVDVSNLINEYLADKNNTFNLYIWYTNNYSNEKHNPLLMNWTIGEKYTSVSNPTEKETVLYENNVFLGTNYLFIPTKITNATYVLNIDMIYHSLENASGIVKYDIYLTVKGTYDGKEITFNVKNGGYGYSTFVVKSPESINLYMSGIVNGNATSTTYGIKEIRLVSELNLIKNNTAPLNNYIIPMFAIGVAMLIGGAYKFNGELPKSIIASLGLGILFTAIILYLVPAWQSTYVPIIAPITFTVGILYFMAITKILNSEKYVKAEYFLLKYGDSLSLVLFIILVIEMWTGVLAWAFPPAWGW